MKTRRLYYENVYQKEFKAVVEACQKVGDRFEVRLDQTCFYPEGGGQPCDLGFLDQVAVLDVQEKEGEIWHTVAEEMQIGQTTFGRIDWNRRFDLMQQHSGEHIVSGLIHGKYGMENVGFHLTTDQVVINVGGVLSMEQLREIERLANERIWANEETIIWVPDANELAQTAYRSKKALTGDVRLVRFPESDCCACCGTHVKRAGEIGLIRILSCQKHKGGVQVEMRCGGRALDYDVMCAEQNHKVGVALSVSEEGTAEAVRRLQEEIGALKMELSALQWKELQKKVQTYVNAGDVLVFEDDLMPDRLCKLAVEIMEHCGGRCAAFSGDDESGYKYAIGENNGDVRALVKEMNASLNGRGGGKPFFAQGSVKATKAQIEAFFET